MSGFAIKVTTLLFQCLEPTKVFISGSPSVIQQINGVGKISDVRQKGLKNVCCHVPLIVSFGVQWTTVCFVKLSWIWGSVEWGDQLNWLGGPFKRETSWIRDRLNVALLLHKGAVTKWGNLLYGGTSCHPCLSTAPKLGPNSTGPPIN